MRSFCIFGSFFLCHLTSQGQEVKRVSIQEGSNLKDVVIYHEVYSYPEFIAGSVYFKEGTKSTAKLNYNRLLGQMQFIDTKGDTLSIDNENSIKEIIIGTDTLYYNKEYLKLIVGSNTVKLAVAENIKIIDRQKTGAYGQQLSSSSVNSLSNISIGTQLTTLSVKQQVTLAANRKFYIGDQFNHFMFFNKKNTLKMFGKHQNKIESYLAKNSINFNDERDLLTLVGFIQSL
jgi:hypothetical protein